MPNILKYYRLNKNNLKYTVSSIKITRLTCPTWNYLAPGTSRRYTIKANASHPLLIVNHYSGQFTKLSG